MPLATAARNVAAAALAAQATHLSLHSDVPDNLGSNEVLGGSPAYARQPVTWVFPDAGVMAIAAPAVFDVPAGAVVYVGMWTLAVAGDFLGYAPLNGGLIRGTAYAQGATDDFYAPSHGLVVGDRVSFLPVPGGTPPTGVGGLLYYVVSVTNANLFQVAATPFDQPLAIGSDGPVQYQRATVDQFSAQGTETVSTLSIVIGA
ncbi:MAG: hypothetical protein BWY85_00105 [Firmicutes bacterium ADurb.Bin506]|nr:MAG: hypothetical protein BWY85_00105 [Firmicutes bacterium ADurb.Bin506]